MVFQGINESELIVLKIVNVDDIVSASWEQVLAILGEHHCGDVLGMVINVLQLLVVLVVDNDFFLTGSH